MKEISAASISRTIKQLCLDANLALPADVSRAVAEALTRESSATGRDILGEIRENEAAALAGGLALCQDTGIVDVFVALGQDAHITGGTLAGAVNRGVAEAYGEGYFRKSLVADPLRRVNTGDNTPAQLTIETVPGDSIQFTVLPKGGGSENASAVLMLTPSAGWEGIKSFVVDQVRRKGINACPPLVVGVGIGGNFSSVSKLAKKALLREIGSRAADPFYEEKEGELLAALNATGIGPMGLGGLTTALAVHIESAPCHIASLPAAVSMQCHSCRRKSAVL